MNTTVSDTTLQWGHLRAIRRRQHDARKLEHKAAYAIRERDRAIARAVNAGVPRRMIAASLGLTPTRITQIVKTQEAG